MKNVSLLVCALILVTACTKVKVERSGPTVIGEPEPIKDTVVTDTATIQAGFKLGMEYFYVNRVLDLSSSTRPLDSLYYDIEVNGKDRLRFLVKNDTFYYPTSGNTYNFKGIYFTETDSSLKAGEKCMTGLYAFNFRDELNYSSLCSPNYDTADFDRSGFPLQTLAIFYDSNSGVQVRGWSKYGVGMDGLGDGYFGFRFHDGDLVKYGWVHLDLLSNNKLHIIEYAYQK